jgi:uncharacterized protein
MSIKPVGRVAALWRYPVKSMRGEFLTSARLWWHGVEGDRRFAFLRTTHRSHFPWLTGREVPSLLLYQPQLALPLQPATSPVTVVTPEGTALPLEAPALQARLEQDAREPLHLLHLGRGTFDSAGLSLISTASLTTLSQSLAHPLTPARFRANILVETAEVSPYPEEIWIGSTLQLGTRADSARIRLVRPIKRCMMINLDPETAEQEPAILRAVVQQHEQQAGVYGITEQVGTVMIGDPLFLL